MTKFRECSQKEIVSFIIKALPEINPVYVISVLRSMAIDSCSIVEVSSWIRYFEMLLYDNNEEET